MLLLFMLLSILFRKPFHSVGFFYCTQLAFTCSKLTIETLEQRVKYVPS